MYVCVHGFSPAFGHGNTGNAVSQKVLKALLSMLCLDWHNILCQTFTSFGQNSLRLIRLTKGYRHCSPLNEFLVLMY